jgi:dihydrofolate reductase
VKALACIVAVADDGVIGRGGQLPWHVPEDLKRFKALTMGHALVMGRATHESIGRALPGRRNVVVTRQARTFEGCEVAHSLDEALALVADDPLPFLIGGAELYRLGLARVTHLFLTKLALRVPDGDAFFPALDPAEWTQVRSTPGTQPGVTFVDLERVSGQSR